MADKTLRRWLVQWSEKVAYQDIAYVSDDEVRTSMGMSEQAWDDLDDGDRASYTRAHINMMMSVAELAGTQRWRRRDAQGFDVLAAAVWPRGEDEPDL